MAPTYLKLSEAAERLAEKTGEKVTPDWLLQYVVEGRLQLFFILRRVILADFADESPAFLAGEFLPLNANDAGWILAQSDRDWSFRVSAVLGRNGQATWILDAHTGRRRPVEIGFGDIYVLRMEVDQLAARSGDFQAGSGDVKAADTDSITPAEEGESASQSHDDEPDTNGILGHVEKPKALPWGVTKSEILSVSWPMPLQAPTLEDILDRIPKWVDEACKRVGRVGKGREGSHLWNPAILAVCLASTTPQKRWSCNKMALTNFLRAGSFSEYFGEWEEYAEKL